MLSSARLIYSCRVLASQPNLPRWHLTVKKNFLNAQQDSFANRLIKRQSSNKRENHSKSGDGRISAESVLTGRFNARTILTRVLLASVVALGGLSAWAWTSETFEKEKQTGCELLLQVLDGSESQLLKRQAAKLLAFFCRHESVCLKVERAGGFKVLFQTFPDVETNMYVLQIVNRMLQNERLRSIFVEKGGIQWIRSVVSIMKHLDYARTNPEANMFISSELCSILGQLHKRPDWTSTVKEIGFGDISYVLHNSLTSPELRLGILGAMARIFAAEPTENPEAASISLLKRIVNQSVDVKEKTEAVQMIADLCLNRRTSFELVHEHDCLGILDTMRDTEDEQLIVEIVRCIANMAANELNAVPILEANWLQFLGEKISAVGHSHRGHKHDNTSKDSVNINTACLIAIGNLSTSELISAAMMKDKDMIYSLTHTSVYHGTAEKQQLSRIIANIAAHDGVIATEAFHDFGLECLRKLCETKDEDFVIRSNVARATANFAVNSDIAFQIILDHNERYWDKLILQLGNIDESLEIQRHIARAVANLAVNVARSLKAKEGLADLLKKWSDSADVVVHSEAMRARASLANSDHQGPKYGQGIYLFYPQDKEQQRQALEAAFSSSRVLDANTEFDVVFIHGVSGDPFGTWIKRDPGTAVTIDLVDLSEIEIPFSLPFEAPQFPWHLLNGIRKKDNAKEKTPLLIADVAEGEVENSKVVKPEKPATSTTIIWPRDWLPESFPNARILSVGYDLSLSRWVGDALPLEQQSMEIMNKLNMAGVGKKPTIFITHSFGGLIAKQMLVFASQSDEFRHFLENTVGIVFFATPHRGAGIARYSKTLAGTVMRKTSVIDELRPDSSALDKLNRLFPEIAPKVSTLSFGENDRTCIGSQYTCFQLVADESANPGFEGTLHEFMKLNLNHRQVCKISNKDEDHYRKVLEFIRSGLLRYNKLHAVLPSMWQERSVQLMLPVKNTE
eukprot:TRINITY_DN4813_c0_g1_i2.p1 TRINITY_DN4813_c0_g1~~TRINITY_DN4813_c0_g1_i2.p1  ORF type:complete len:967 (-),score=177.73 TRINITY_DN4813_c0_g1_i2:15-2915(-)